MTAFRLWWPNHTFWVLTKFVGLRDRLRCPECSAVGTWKPHGGLIEERGTPRRWLCKWCGFYESKDWPRAHCQVSNAAGCWVTPDFDGDGTPQEAIRQSAIPNVWPWRG